MQIKTIIFILILLNVNNSMAVEQKNSCHRVFVSQADSQFNVDRLVEVYESIVNEKPGMKRDMLQAVLLRDLNELKHKNQNQFIREFYEKISVKIQRHELKKAIVDSSQAVRSQYLLNIQPQGGIYLNDKKIILMPADQKNFFEFDPELNQLTQMNSLDNIFKLENSGNKLMAFAHSDKLNLQVNSQFSGLTNSSNNGWNLRNLIFLNQDFFIYKDKSYIFKLYKKTGNKKEKHEEVDLQLINPIFIGNMSDEIHLFVSNNNLLIYNSKYNYSQYHGLPQEFDTQKDWRKITFTDREIYIPSESDGRYYFERLTFSSTGSVLRSTFDVNAHGKDEIFKFIKNHQIQDFNLVVLPSNKGKYVLFELVSNNVNTNGKIEKMGLLMDFSDPSQFSNPYTLFEYSSGSDFYIYENHFYFKTDLFSAFEIKKINRIHNLNLLVLPKVEQLKNVSIGVSVSERSFKNNLEVHLNAENEIDVYHLSTREHNHFSIGLPKKAIVKDIKFVSDDNYLMVTYFLQNKKYLMLFPVEDLRL